LELPANIAAKRQALLDRLSSYGRVAVAFSGGVDSAVVTKAARLACGERAVAVTALSASLASGELDGARELAALIGIEHRVIETDEFQSTGYQRNAGDRCYYCKSELYTQMERLRSLVEFDVIVNGANLDDVGDHRPGMAAARERDVRSPLIEAGITKAEVRELARDWGLPVWDKPAAPCLSSRIAYGVEVTPERVRRVDAAERFLKERLGLRELRVRLESHDLARIEVPLAELPRLVQEQVRSEVVAHLESLGFRSVTIDLRGFRSGSLNAMLPMADLQMNWGAAGA
jgi:uncharacterized protein